MTLLMDPSAPFSDAYLVCRGPSIVDMQRFHGMLHSDAKRVQIRTTSSDVGHVSANEVTAIEEDLRALTSSHRSTHVIGQER